MEAAIDRLRRTSTFVFVGVIDPPNPAIEAPTQDRDRIELPLFPPVGRLRNHEVCGFAPFADDTSTGTELASRKLDC